MYLQQTDSANGEVSTERSHESKGVEASSFSLWRYRTTYTTVVVDVGPFGSVGCVAQVPSMARLS